MLLILDTHDPRIQNEFWLGADLVVEIVSPDMPQRDMEEELLDYAEAGIPEYWIVNLLTDTITVLTLDDQQYVSYGRISAGRGRDLKAAARLLVEC